MKSYTDLEQSKKLAKVLPLTSADMCYKCIGEDPYDVCLRPYSEWKEEYKGLLVAKEVEVIPCWSLAALLNYLREIDYFPEIVVDKDEVSMHYYYYDESIGNVSKIFAEAENFIDACYEMILKLHEL